MSFWSSWAAEFVSTDQLPPCLEVLCVAFHPLLNWNYYSICLGVTPKASLNAGWTLLPVKASKMDTIAAVGEGALALSPHTCALGRYCICYFI